ncbi:TPA: hypothetical protein HA251_03120 [Candidatus Woesearchaeota archaeon]|nr:hypothetical protein [Candidatus Woesearchaeota archaeon]
MAPRTIAIIVLLLLIAPLALADTLELVSPANGVSIEPTVNGVSFRTDSKDSVKSCTVFIDDEPKKTLTYNDVITGRTLQLSLDIPDGEHRWNAICVMSDGTTIASETRTFTAANVKSAVTAKSSGLFRGSMAYEFSFENTAEQEPVIVKKLAAGDFIWVIFKIPPSNIKKELYIKRFAVEQGTPFIYLEDLKKREVYKIARGENGTINISSSSVIVNFVDIELNRAVVAVYPFIQDGTTEETPNNLPDEDAAPTDDDATTDTVDTVAGSTSDDNEDGTEGTIDDVATPPQENADSSTDSTPGQDDAPEGRESKGVFTRFIAWLASIFGA